jgi:tetratricopeptide (TPR) repeat protein
LISTPQALDLLTNQIGADVPPELWSNIGALRHQLGDLAGARDAFDKAQAAMAPTGDPDPELKEVFTRRALALVLATLVYWMSTPPLPLPLPVPAMAFVADIGVLRCAVQYYDQLGVTLNYNIARLHESMGNQSAAEAMYKDILKEHPSYIDCMVMDQMN